MRAETVDPSGSALGAHDDPWRQAVDQAPVGIALTDLQGRVTYANAALTRLLHCDAPSLLGRPLGHLWSVEQERSDREQFSALVAGHIERFQATRHLTRTDGTQLAVRLQVAVATSALGEPAFGVLHLDDVSDSETEQLQEALLALQHRTRDLKRSNEDLMHFAAVVSHDLRAPLSAIQGFSELIEEASDENEPAQLREWRRRIASSAGRMGELVDSLLEYSKATGQRERDSFDSQLLILEVVADLHREIRDSEADVSWGDSLPVITGTQVQLRRLLQNLLQNAMKYRRPDVPAAVHLDVRETGDGWLVRVADNGVGVSDAAKHEIFEMYRQQRDTDGYGIGLATCARIVAEHGGRIWVEDNQPHGSVFCFTLSANL